MRKPSIEEIRVIIYDYSNENWREIEDGRVDYHEAAVDIFNLHNPAMKPLSELANNEEDCRKVMIYMARNVRFKRIDKHVSLFVIQGFCAGMDGVEMTLSITVFHDGRGILFNNDGNVLTFKLAHFIQKLGYDVTPETK